jgi:GT2 family glycosyltransferase
MLVAPVESGADVCTGFFQGAPRTTFEKALVATTLPDVDEIDPARFIASSRSIAFTRATWKAVEGYPEWLDYCEDVVFVLKLRSAGYRFAWEPGAIVHYRPRTSVSSYARQYYLYARGDGKANIWPYRHLARYLTYTVVPLVTLSGFWYKRSWLLVAVGVSIYLYRPWRRVVKATRGLPAGDRLLAFGYVPYLRLIGDAAKMIGYPVGVLWRLRRERTDG